MVRVPPTGARRAANAGVLAMNTPTVRSSSTGEKECAGCAGYINMRSQLCANPVRPECLGLTEKEWKDYAENR